MTLELENRQPAVARGGAAAGVFGPPTGLESNTAEGSALALTGTGCCVGSHVDTRQTTGLMIGGRLLAKVW